MSREEFVSAFLETPPSQFVADRLFDRTPALFGDDRHAFVAWRGELSQRIDVDPACLIVVGSAAIGFSLNPNKNFRVYDKSSDIDVAVVSEHHFNVGWRYLRKNGSRRARLDKRTRVAWDEHVNRYIYWGTLATDRLLGVLPFGIIWLKALSFMAGIEPTKGQTVNLRIYMDHDSLRGYHVQGVRALRERAREVYRNA